MSSGYDAEVAELFRDLRAASSLTETDLAARIAAPIEVVQALEQGAIYALPPWPETCRVVNAYGTLLNLDTGPLLRRIYAQIEAGIVELTPKTMPDVPVMTPQASGDAVLGGNAGPRPQAIPEPPPMPEPPVWPNGQGGALQPPMPPPQLGHPQVPQAQFPQVQIPQPQVSQQQAWPGDTMRVPQGAPNAAPAQAEQAPAWPNGPQAQQPQPYGQPAAYQQPQGYAPEPGAPQEDAAFMGEPEAGSKTKRPALLKWGIGALIASVVLIGLWMVLGNSSSDPGSSSGFNTSDPVLDADDPRSRKADRLPDNF